MKTGFDKLSSFYAADLQLCFRMLKSRFLTMQLACNAFMQLEEYNFVIYLNNSISNCPIVKKNCVNISCFIAENHIWND